MHRLLAPCLTATAILLASPALAQEPASGSVILSVDRIFGFVTGSFTRSESEDGSTVESTESYTEISLLAGSPVSIGFLFSTPRLSLDFMVTDGLTLGGGIGYTTFSGEQETTFDGETRTDNVPTITTFVFAPRIGYLASFNPTVGIWPRAGVTYMTVGSEQEEDGDSAESTMGVTAFTAEVPLVIMPAPHVMLTLGLTLDTSLSVTREQSFSSDGSPTQSEEDPGDLSMYEFGLQAGLAAWF